MVQYVKVTTSMTWTDRQVVSMLDRMKCWWRTRQVRKLTEWSTATNEFQIGLYSFSLIRRYSIIVNIHVIRECKKLILNVCNVIFLSLFLFFEINSIRLLFRNYRIASEILFLSFPFFFFSMLRCFNANKVATLVHSEIKRILRLYRIVTRRRWVSMALPAGSVAVDKMIRYS